MLRDATDERLAEFLAALDRTAARVLVVANGFTVRVCVLEHAGAGWQDAAFGDFGRATAKVASPLIKRRTLLWADVAGPTEDVDLAIIVAVPATMASVRAWLRKADSVANGRGSEASEKTRMEVAALAAWRCQFEGCGADLRKHPTTGKRGNYGHFAHIVASSANGPRGSVEESALLSDVPTNFLLLCDPCHRLIDRVSPTRYPSEVLREMQERNIFEVERVLDSLKHDAAECLVVVNNVAGQRPAFQMRDADEALWGAGLRAAQGSLTWYFQPGAHQHDPHAADYWGSLFRVAQRDLYLLKAYLEGSTSAGGARPRLAVFGLHSTSVLILTGRILGDTGGTHVFQPHRNKLDASRTRWSWPAGAKQPGDGKYQVRVFDPPAGPVRDACSLVSLTFAIEARRLPPAHAQDGKMCLPAVEVFVDEPHAGVIEHPNDLASFGVALDKALREVQDQWGAGRVHLFVAAPAAACIVVGQKMQARNQATFVCYESKCAHGSSFEPTIEISGTDVRELVSGQGNLLSLRL